MNHYNGIIHFGQSTKFYDANQIYREDTLEILVWQRITANWCSRWKVLTEIKKTIDWISDLGFEMRNIITAAAFTLDRDQLLGWDPGEPRWDPGGTRWAKVGPRWTQVGPRWGPGGPRWDQIVKPNFQSKWHPFGLAVARNLHSKAFTSLFYDLCLKLGGLLQKILGSILMFVETANTQVGWFLWSAQFVVFI